MVIGSIAIWFSISSLLSYNHLTLFKSSDITIAKNLILGIFCLLLGVGGLVKVKLVKGHRILIFMFLSYSLIWSIKSFIQQGDFDLEFALIPDYFLIFLIQPSLKSLVENESSTLNRKFAIQNLKPSLGSIVSKSLGYNLLIYLASLTISSVCSLS